MFISKVKHYRTKAGLSQGQLGKLTGLSQAQISHIENNTTSTTLDTLDLIATALNCCSHDLYECHCERYESCTRPDKDKLNCFPKE